MQLIPLLLAALPLAAAASGNTCNKIVVKTLRAETTKVEICESLRHGSDIYLPNKLGNFEAQHILDACDCLNDEDLEHDPAPKSKPKASKGSKKKGSKKGSKKGDKSTPKPLEKLVTSTVTETETYIETETETELITATYTIYQPRTITATATSTETVISCTATKTEAVETQTITAAAHTATITATTTDYETITAILEHENHKQPRFPQQARCFPKGQKCSPWKHHQCCSNRCESSNKKNPGYCG